MDAKSSEYQQQFMLLKLSAEYDVLASQSKLADRTMSFYLTGIAILASVAAAILSDLGGTAVANINTNLMSVAILLLISSGSGLLTGRRLLQQRLTMISILERVRSLERYFTARHPVVKQYLLTHALNRRLDHSTIERKFFSKHATSILQWFSLWNALQFGLGLAIAVYLTLTISLSPLIRFYLPPVSAIIGALIVLLVNTLLLRRARKASKGWGAYETALAQGDADERNMVQQQNPSRLGPSANQGNQFVKEKRMRSTKKTLPGNRRRASST